MISEFMKSRGSRAECKSDENFLSELIQDVYECDIRLYRAIEENERGIAEEELIKLHRPNLVKERLKVFEAYGLIVRRGKRFYPGPEFFKVEINGLPKNSDIFYNVFRTPLAEIILMVVYYYKPITIKDIHKMVVKKVGRDVHYNIVYRLVKRMKDHGVISKRGGRYVSNLFWLFPSFEELKQRWLEYLQRYCKRGRASKNLASNSRSTSALW